jgi:2,4-dienoyl-CoA reductase-like NADH-dependent reductase (Old Yellow Enzyme family)
MPASSLFSPLQLGPIELANRIAVAPMCQYSAHDGCASDWHSIHLGRLGMSGAALVMLEATAVERRGRITHGCLGLYDDECEAALLHTLARVRRVAGPARFGIQLAHAGRKASTHLPWAGGRPLGANEDPWQTVSASDKRFDADWHMPAPLDSAGLAHVRTAFVRAAERAVRLGFEVIELHGAHGYLLHQFLSPIANVRTDEFGGSLENRMRFPLSVVAAVRAVVPPHIAFGIRVSATDWVDGGWTLDDTVEFARAAKSQGIEWICVSSGGMSPAARMTIGPGYQVEFAARVRQDSGLVTRTAGLITSPRQAEQIIAQGKADQVALARAFLDNPSWGWHAADALGVPGGHVPLQYLRGRDPAWLKIKAQV